MLSGGKIGNIILGDKPAEFGVVVTRLQIVQVGLFVVEVSAVTERVQNAHAACKVVAVCVQDRMVAPRVIDIFRDHHARVIENVRDVPLRVLAVQIIHIVALHTAQAVTVIDELQRIRSVALPFVTRCLWSYSYSTTLFPLVKWVTQFRL